MYGSFLYNCWAALIGFTLYFIIALQIKFVMPLTVMLGSFVTATLLFLLMYGVRYLLGYVLYTPTQVEFPTVEDSVVTVEHQKVANLPHLEQISTNEFEDESSEEIAQVVRTMMHQEQQTVPNA